MGPIFTYLCFPSGTPQKLENNFPRFGPYQRQGFGPLGEAKGYI